MKKILYILMCISLCTDLFCQGKKKIPNQDYKYAFEVNGFASKILKHTPKFLPQVTEISAGFEICASYKTFGKKNWQQVFNYPEIGIAYVQTHFGNADIFGNSYGLMPFSKFYIARSKIVNLHARLGAGLAYITKSYDAFDNPSNNVIGSKLNTLVQFRMGLDFHVTSQIDLQIAGSFTHYSNSATQAPNLGINIPAGSLGLIYKPKQFEDNYIKEQNIEEFKKKNEYTFKFGLGLREKNIGATKYPVYSFGLQYARYFGYANKLLAGTTLSFDQYEYDFMLVHEINVDKDQTYQAMDWSVYLGYEMMLGKIGLSFLVGTYILDPAFKGPPIFAKPGITYYFAEFGKQKHKPFIGINMKTNYFVAQYVEMNFGIAF